MKHLLMYFLICTSANALASTAGDKGNILDINIYEGFNGGDAVVCRDGKEKIKLASLLDYAEKFKQNKKTPISYERDIDVYDFMTVLANKLERVAPDVFFLFRREAIKLAIEFEKFENTKLPKHKDVAFTDVLVGTLDDMNPVTSNINGCKVEKMVIRERKIDGISYQVRSETFKHLSAKDRRGLVIHEALYHSFSSYYGDQDSIRTRYFHRSIMQYPLHMLTDSVIRNILRNAENFF